VAAHQAPAAGAPPTPASTPADKQARLNAIRQDATKRAIVSYTIAKTLLPKSDSAIVAKFAAALIEAPTSLITAAFRELAMITAKVKLAEKFEDISKTKLNEFVDDPSLLSKLQGEVTSELKGEAKTATAAPGAAPSAVKPKTAAPGDVPKDDNLPPVTDAALPGAAATEPPAEMPSTEPPPPPPAAEGDLGAAGDGMPANDAMAAPESGADAGLMSQIEQVEADVSKLENEVSNVEDQALDLAGIFDPEIQAGKANSLANEGDEPMAEAGSDDFFGPSSKGEMEDGMDFGAPEAGNPQDFFAGGHTTASLQVDAFLAGKIGSEEILDGFEDMPSEFKTTAVPTDQRDVATDHQGDMLSEVLDSLDQETMNQKRDTAPKLQTPEAVQASAAPNGGRTAAQAKAAVAAGPKAPAGAPKRSAVNPGQPGLPKQASATDVTPAELDSLLFRDRF
jgi:hypothetical protein